MADDDDTDSQQELEEKGYTLPEYAFTVKCDDAESNESGQLDVMGWIKTQFRDRRTGKPIANRKYTIYLSDGTTKTGTTDSDGFVYEKDLKHGGYYIEFGE
ncbi:MAG: SpaA isopeptide-forming pilin-related protein [Spirochaetales bacterium]|nr:SpaA isopeptide-forming pilin-related protein [Spirochaetales bacterium]